MLLPKPALPGSHHSYGLMRQTKFLPPSSYQLLQRVFAGCHQPLLEDGPSRRYLRKSFPRCLDPYPDGLLWCIYPFLPIETSAFPKRTMGRLSHNVPYRDFSTGAISRLQSFLYVQAPRFARHSGRSHLSLKLTEAAVTFTSEHLTVRYLTVPRIC